MALFSFVPYALRRLSSLGGLFSPQRKTVGNHGDKFAVGGLALDVGDGVAEELLHGRNVIYRTVYRYRLL